MSHSDKLSPSDALIQAVKEQTPPEYSEAAIAHLAANLPKPPEPKQPRYSRSVYSAHQGKKEMARRLKKQRVSLAPNEHEGDV